MSDILADPDIYLDIKTYKSLNIGLVENEVSNPNMFVSRSDTLLSPKLNVQYVDILPDIDSFSNL